MRSLNLDQLRSLEVVAELGSFTAAAKRLSLSQSAVSTQIRELEERFGVRLVERLGKRAFATAAGREVIEHAQRIAREAEAVAAAMRRHRDGWLGRVRLGTGPNVLAYLLPPVLKTLRETQPNVEIAIRSGTTRDMVALLVRNELDLAVATMPIDDRVLTVTPLRDDALCAILPESETDAPAEMTPEDFRQRQLILDGRSRMDRMIRAWLEAGGVEARPAMELGSPEAIRSVVAAGLGMSILSPEVITGAVPLGGIIVRPLRPPIVRTTALVQRRDKPDDPALGVVRDALMALHKPPAREFLPDPG
jgi:DNA-binding transcriptional LysR family regulator